MTDPLAPRPDKAANRRNTRVALACAGLFCGMVGLAFASVPLYQLFCQVTGFGGTPQVAETAEGVTPIDRLITVRFDANTSPHLPWQFEAEQKSVTLRLGDVGVVNYRARNLSDVALVGTAAFNVTPDPMGAFFSKIACFCFTEQRLEPGQEILMPVTFYVDPAMVDDADTASIRTVTLSYTFFPVATPAKPVAAAPVEPATTNRL